MNIDEMALKLYGIINLEELMEAKRNGKVLEHFVKIAKELQGTDVLTRVSAPIREAPVPERRVRESEVRQTPTRRRAPQPSVEEGVRVSGL